MRESIQKLVRLQSHILTFLIAPTIQGHDVWNLWQEREVGKIEGSPNTKARAEAVVRVDAMPLKRMRQSCIGPSLVYPAVGAVSHITIDYTATSDSYSIFVTARLPPQQYERKIKDLDRAW